MDLKEGLTFDDVLLVPDESAITPADVKLHTRLTKNITLNMPIISAAMDTVTESQLAIRMAEEGGIGIIHKNLPIEQQAREVKKVKRAETYIIDTPITLSPDKTVGDAIREKGNSNVSCFPIVDNNKLVGIVTNRDLRFEEDINKPLSKVMTHEKLVTVPQTIRREEAKKLLHHHRIEKLLVVDNDFHLVGLITIKDIEKSGQYPTATKDAKGRLLVGAAIGIGKDTKERLKQLLDAEVDVIAVDTAHGHSKNVLETIAFIRKEHPSIEIIGGNVVTGEATMALIKAGVSAVKVGVGPGSICTTRIIAGVGVPQITAVSDCYAAAHKYDIPIIADGGIRFSGDVIKALAVGAETVMIGNLLAGTEESPGDLVFYQGRSYKVYRGMGSVEAMKQGSKDRYFQEGTEEASKLVPEGIEGRVPFRGLLSNVLFQLLGGIRSGMGYCGCPDITTLHQKAKLIKITHSGYRESHVHDVIITKEASNYSIN